MKTKELETKYSKETELPKTWELEDSRISKRQRIKWQCPQEDQDDAKKIDSKHLEKVVRWEIWDLMKKDLDPGEIIIENSDEIEFDKKI